MAETCNFKIRTVFIYNNQLKSDHNANTPHERERERGSEAKDRTGNELYND
jgi:hypothetical protein